MTDPNVLEFVARLTELQLNSDPRASVVDVSRGLLSNLAIENSPESHRKASPNASDIVAEMAERSVKTLPNTLRLDGVFLVAPAPKSPEQSGETYDPMVSVDELPKFESLPTSFGTTDYSAIRLNDETAAISNEHYFDLLAIRDECKTLREDKARLEAMMIESARRHVAIEELAKYGVYIHVVGQNVFVSLLGIEETGESITECMERAVEAVAKKKATDSITVCTEIMDAMNVQLETQETINGRPVVEVDTLPEIEPGSVSFRCVTPEDAANVIAPEQIDQSTDEKWTDAEKQILRDAASDESLVSELSSLGSITPDEARPLIAGIMDSVIDRLDNPPTEEDANDVW